MASPRECSQLLLETIPKLMRSLGSLVRQHRLADEEGLTMGQFRLLQMLASRPWTLSELAAIHQVTPSTMSRSADVLVRRGWLTREEHPDDRRQVLLSRTVAGG